MKRVLITGGMGGIGRAIISEFQEQDYFVECVTSKDSSQYDSLPSGNVRFHKCDLTNLDDIKVLKQYLRVDPPEILINNAATYNYYQSLSDIHINNMEITFRVNVLAPIELSIAYAEEVSNRGIPGKIINISSIGAKNGGRINSIDYTASKSALESATLTLGKVFADKSVTVNCIRLGVVDTALHKKNPSKDMNKRVERIPLKRLIHPAEIAKFIVILVSYQSSAFTASIVDLSGGE